MSLKAKIEAVIYASEEPVTLAQLVGLLGEEAQAELDRAMTQQTLALNESEVEAQAEEESDPLTGSAFETDGAEAVLEPVEVEDAVAAEESSSVGPETDEAAAVLAPVEVDGAVEEPCSASAEADVEAAEVESTVEAEAVESVETESAAGTVESAAAEIAAAVKAEKARLVRLRAYFREVLDGLVREYATTDRGLEIREVGGGFRLATKPEYHDAVRGFVKSLKPPLKLTLQALETLAVVAYKQPVTAPEISEIRGVDSGGVVGSLIARKLITTAGRKHVIGRPILYKTTKEFLLKFGLKDVNELPSIEEFEKMAGQMAEQEEMAMEHEAPQTTEERLESDQEAPAPEPIADEVIVDGRESGLPPVYDGAADDPSAAEAAIQESGSGEGEPS